ncbi:small basic family protein [Sulfoacidibacillus thermotolerans]|uniref:Small basic protein n=1 Tax=Sulfoacidibacillus thermotolerans TaxID=1765684 RepID=A0A2U3D8U4_SULT2|nr:small basic family protein [Sulfoacidibacillus thermotolerans]PWI57698.1 small basic protein [Sulfoacidibacillus thermotolerans]
MWIFVVPAFGLFIGLGIGLAVNVHLPVQYSAYLSVAILAALDTVFGGIRAMLEHKFDERVFLTGFFSNTLLAALLAFIGSWLGIDLTLAAVVAFGVRIFNNLASIRHLLLFRKKIPFHDSSNSC